PGSIKKQSLALFLLRLPAFVPLIFVARGWLDLNAKDVLTLTEANVLGTGGEICFFVSVSITPIITLTGARWIAPLRRWYGIMFAVIGIADAVTAAITGDFAGGVVGRLAGHTLPARRLSGNPLGPPAAGHRQHPGATKAWQILETP